jgi:hypothetical protein
MRVKDSRGAPVPEIWGSSESRFLVAAAADRGVTSDLLANSIEMVPYFADVRHTLKQSVHDSTILVAVEAKDSEMSFEPCRALRGIRGVLAANYISRQSSYFHA